jgi:hypothetical protein
VHRARTLGLAIDGWHVAVQLDFDALAERGSMTRAGERLNLHRNAVAYRIRQAFELLDVDEGNPDDLLLLQLACRARELG